MTSSAHDKSSPQAKSARGRRHTKGDAGDTYTVRGTVLDASEQSQDPSDTRGRDADGSSQGALLTMNRHQRAPATRKEARADACVAFGRKSHHSRVAASALRFTAFAARILLAPASADI